MGNFPRGVWGAAPQASTAVETKPPSLKHSSPRLQPASRERDHSLVSGETWAHHRNGVIRKVRLLFFLAHPPSPALPACPFGGAAKGLPPPQPYCFPGPSGPLSSLVNASIPHYPHLKHFQAALTAELSLQRGRRREGECELLWRASPTCHPFSPQQAPLHICF